MGKLRTKIGRVLAVTLGVAAVAAGVSAPAAAGDTMPAIGTVEVDLFVFGADAPAVLGGLDIELLEVGPPMIDRSGLCDAGTPDSISAVEDARRDTCTGVPAEPTTYNVNVLGAPDEAIVDVFCFGNLLNQQIPGDEAMFTIDRGETIFCRAEVLLPTLFVDKVVDDSNGGSATPGDFTLEVYSGGAQVATATDTSTGVCDFVDVDGCAVVPLELGDYQLGETAAPGYLPTNVYCQPFFFRQPAEVFPTGIGTFTLGTPFSEQEGAPFAYCEVTNGYYEGDLVVEKVVVNDNGGTATAADFTAEVFTEPGGSAVASEVCAADGSCIDAAVPVGSYRIGETGPDGYTASVACTVTREPDVPDIGETVTTRVPLDRVADREALPGAEAVAVVEAFGEVTCVITNDDDVPPTTTTTTTTTTLPATTTTVAALLPETGSDASRTGSIMLLAIGFLMAGGAMLAVRRR